MKAKRPRQRVQKKLFQRGPLAVVAAGGSSHVRKVVCCATGNFRLLAWPRGEEVEAGQVLWEVAILGS